MSYLKKFKQQKDLLDREYDWPAEYLFKFIVPKEKEQAVRNLFPNHEPEIRPSKKGNYVSLSVSYRAESSDMVLAIYERASLIEGLIAL